MKRIHLRTLRERAKLTQVELAEQASVDQKTISRLELDPDADPAYTTQTRIARVLHVDPEIIAFGPDPKRAEAAAS